MNKKTVLMYLPRAWDSTWGQEKDLINMINDEYSVIAAEFIDHEALKRTYDVPENTEVLFRKTKLGLGFMYLLHTEWRNLCDAWNTNYDIMVTYMTTCTMLATIVAKLRGKKILLIYADDLPELYRKHSWFGVVITRFITNPLTALLSDHITVTARLLREDIGHKKKSTYLPNGVDLTKIGDSKPKKSKKFTIGFVGFFGEWVNFDLVLRVARRNPKIQFLLVGGGGQYDDLRKKAKKLKNVKFTGFVHKSKVNEYLDQVDVCMIPFHVNRLTDRVSPIKLFEYWAKGKPVISTRFYELEKTGKDICLFADTTKQFEKAIEQLQNPQTYDKLKEKSLEEVKKFDWNDLGKKYLRILKNL